jgi:hypothetical protein
MQSKMYKITNIWLRWNKRDLSSDDAMTAIGKLLPDYYLNPKKKATQNEQNSV